MHHPLGILQMDGSTIIRVARAKTHEGSLLIQGCVPPAGSAVQVMESSENLLLAVADDVGRDALLGNPEAAVVIAFSCAMRARLLKGKTSEEAARLHDAAGGAAVFGMYCCGEFARVSGTLGTHNATLTAIAL